jgi:hypothetical protein
MGGSKEKSLDDEQRLLAMREHLGVRAWPHDKAFESEVVDSAVRKVQPVIDRNANSAGEMIIAAVAKQLRVRFEEVRSDADIRHLEQKYLVEKKELGFGMLAQELADRNVDALLFQRMHASGDEPDRWVAVLNLKETQARAYWSRPHELIHRLAEPPQRRLPLYRHRADAQNRLERIIDLGAAELAFPRVAFERRVKVASHHDLTWETVKNTQLDFAPTSSLLSAAKAFLRFWPHPAFLLQATVRGRRARPNTDVALRINIEGFSPSAQQSGIRFFPNMRVPPSSPIFHTFEAGRDISDVESLGRWVTSGGEKLLDRRALVSGLHLGRVVYGLVSLI